MKKYVFYLISFSVLIIGSLVLPASAQIGSQHFGDINTIKVSTQDSSTWAYITATNPKVNERMSITVEFRTADGRIMENVYYDIKAIQDGKTILDTKGANSYVGNPAFLTTPLDSDNSVNISIILKNGDSIKLIKTSTNFNIEPPYVFPAGEDVQIKTVPEFGSLAIIVLSVSIISIIMFSKRLHLSQF
ncbi:MAG TPA: PEFG-CTERM sorting domain-containing protein [Nitrosarchaeum sp.]|nr:PEFG-CTERM sorting domain-containing protein [Nitrosarchaeum sp.]